MNRYVMVVGTAAVLALCGCGRGTGNPQGGSATTATDKGGTPVMMIGCLIPGSSAPQSNAVGTSGTPVPGFTLIDVTTTSTPASDAGAASGVSGTSGTSTTPQVDTSAPRSYDLVGDNRDDLQKYQNSRVEVTGIVVPSTDTGAGTPV